MKELALLIISLGVATLTSAQTNGAFANDNLTGKYVMAYSSNYLGYHGDPQTEPRIGSGVIIFDGRGHLTGRNTSSMFGKAGASIAGTYEVNPDGSGTMFTATASHDGTVVTSQFDFRFTDPAKIRFASPERALDPMGTPRAVGRPTGIMGTLSKE